MTPCEPKRSLLASAAQADARSYNARCPRLPRPTSCCASLMPSCANLTIRWAIFALVAGVHDVMDAIRRSVQSPARGGQEGRVRRPGGHSWASS